MSVASMLPSSRDFRAEASAKVLAPSVKAGPRQPSEPPGGPKTAKLPEHFIADAVQVAEVLANRAFLNPYFENAFIVSTEEVVWEGDITNKDPQPVNNTIVRTSLTII